jgi:hypothetical protein
MSADAADTADTADTTDPADTAERFEADLVAVLFRLDESAEPWKLRPPEDAGDSAKLLVGARPGLVRGRLEGAGYEVRDLELPVERDGWIGAWEVTS